MGQPIYQAEKILSHRFGRSEREDEDDELFVTVLYSRQRSDEPVEHCLKCPGLFRTYALENDEFRDLYTQLDIPEDKKINLNPTVKDRKEEMKMLATSKFINVDGEKGNPNFSRSL